MKRIFSVILLFILSNLMAQTTLIPDYRFERALIDLGIDSDHTINGQILTSDALLVTQLEISTNALTNYPYPPFDEYEGRIHDLTGIEAFINLERLEVHNTLIENLNTDNLVNLKYLDCTDNMLTSISVLNNPLLEYINVTSEGDVYPINDISEIDLRNNPNIQTIYASGLDRINLNNNNNNPNMFISVYCTFCFGDPIDYIRDNICIKVDNVQLAQNNQPPYSSWIVGHNHIEVDYADDLVECSLSNTQFNKGKIDIYPNPVTSGRLYLNTKDITVSRIVMMDFLGRIVLESNELENDSLDISNLHKGNYLLRIISNEAEQTEKLIVE